MKRSNYFDLGVGMKGNFQTLMTVHVRWPGQTSGAIGLACAFLCFFLLHKQKKESKKKEYSELLGSPLESLGQAKKNRKYAQAKERKEEERIV